MKSNFLKKMDEFVKRRLLLSTFACLLLLGVFINFYCVLADVGRFHFYFEIIDFLMRIVCGALILDSIPIFLISLFLTSFLKINNTDSKKYYQKFLILLIVTFLMIFFISSELFQYIDLFSALFAFIYSIIFSAYLSYISAGSKIRIIVCCFTVNLLMILLWIIMCIFHNWGF